MCPAGERHFSKKKRLNTHSVKGGTYRSDGPLSTKNTKKNVHYFILSALPNKKAAPLHFCGVMRLYFVCTIPGIKLLLFVAQTLWLFHAYDKNKN
jgi:hypothetical protein